MKGGYRLTSKNMRFRRLLILLQSIASIRRKLLKTNDTEERSVHTNSERCNIKHDRKIINLIPNKTFRYYNQPIESSIIIRRIRI